MALKSELNKIQHGYHVELWQTYKLTEETHDQISGKLQRRAVETKLDKLNEKQRITFKSDLEAYLAKKKMTHELSSLAQDYVFSFQNDFVFDKRLVNLMNMALIYVVTLMEAFVKEYLTHLYSKRSILLKSGKTITYEEILTQGNMQKVRTFLAEKEVEQVSYKSIDQLAEYLNAKFKLGIDDHLEWWVLCKEASYRRNIIVHNRGIVNSIYASKIQGSPPIGTKLDVSISYLKSSTEAVKSFVTYTHEMIVDKLSIQ